MERVSLRYKSLKKSVLIPPDDESAVALPDADDDEPVYDHELATLPLLPLDAASYPMRGTMWS